MESQNLQSSRVETGDSEDRVFRDLDNRRIGVGSESWVAQVFGVHMTEHGGWVQVASLDHPDDSVVVHVEPGTTAGQIALALSKWSQLPSDNRPTLIEADRIDAH